MIDDAYDWDDMLAARAEERAKWRSCPECGCYGGNHHHACPENDTRDECSWCEGDTSTPCACREG